MSTYDTDNGKTDGSDSETLFNNLTHVSEIDGYHEPTRTYVLDDGTMVIGQSIMKPVECDVMPFNTPDGGMVFESFKET